MLASVVLTVSGTAGAQPAVKVHRIGFLSALSAASMSAREQSFRSGLGELGYVEGKNILIEYRYADSRPERLTALANELVALKVDVIVSTGPTTTRAAMHATSAIPIVMGFDNDPISAGFIASLARPGGNITGLSGLSPEIIGKQLELLKELAPRISKIAILGDPSTAGNAHSIREAERAATVLRVDLVNVRASDRNDLENAFLRAKKARADAVLVLVLANPVTTAFRKEVVSLAAKHKLPATYYSREFVEDGGLMTYGVSVTDLFRRAAVYVDKILKGSKPADLPVEQPLKFELVINLKAASQIGLSVPASVIYRADSVIR